MKKVRDLSTDSAATMIDGANRDHAFDGNRFGAEPADIPALPWRRQGVNFNDRFGCDIARFEYEPPLFEDRASAQTAVSPALKD